MSETTIREDEMSEVERGMISWLMSEHTSDDPEVEWHPMGSVFIATSETMADHDGTPYKFAALAAREGDAWIVTGEMHREGEPAVDTRHPIVCDDPREAGAECARYVCGWQ